MPSITKLSCTLFVFVFAIACSGSGNDDDDTAPPNDDDLVNDDDTVINDDDTVNDDDILNDDDMVDDDDTGPEDLTPPEGSVLLPCSEQTDPVEITVDTHLDTGCVYRHGIEITASDVTLDCRRARIESAPGAGGRGIYIHAPAGELLESVTVRRCEVEGFLNTMRVTREGFQDLPAGGEYDNPFRNIVIEDTVLRNSRGSGIFINAYVTGVTIQNVEVSSAGSVGIYLEAGSKDCAVLDCYLHDNGYGDVTEEGVPFSFNGLPFRYLSTGREGLAIDGSRNNTIRGNLIEGNSSGGIYLYKNCGEYFTEEPNQWWTRRYGADDNTIEENTIRNQRNGIWVGSRMNENQIFMDCSDPAYVDEPVMRYHEDYADRNVVRGNTLKDVTWGIRIEDDEAVVENNTFVGGDAEAVAILLGTAKRLEELGRPVTGTVIRGNESELPSENPYVWIHGHEETIFEGNTVQGAPAALVEGEQPPVDPFLFVRRFWPEP